MCITLAVSCTALPVVSEQQDYRKHLLWPRDLTLQWHRAAASSSARRRTSTTLRAARGRRAVPLLWPRDPPHVTAFMLMLHNIMFDCSSLVNDNHWTYISFKYFIKYFYILCVQVLNKCEASVFEYFLFKRLYALYFTKLSRQRLLL